MPFRAQPPQGCVYAVSPRAHRPGFLHSGLRPETSLASPLRMQAAPGGPAAFAASLHQSILAWFPIR